MLDAKVTFVIFQEALSLVGAGRNDPEKMQTSGWTKEIPQS